MKPYVICRELEVPRWFVDRHLMSARAYRKWLAGSRRRNRARNAVKREHVCVGCGHVRLLGADALRSIASGRTSGRCQDCARRVALGLGPREEGELVPDPSWMRPDECEPVGVWADRVAAELGDELGATIAALDVEAIRDVDESRPARSKRVYAS
jgi:hypothetical protein